ncbi:type 3 dihydrofolate reductase [Methylophaga pinxianii]|uniref:type 3 dihydrofolate reductase n=1 Tax=Methylophaga pinxianii TaxID=2881052 RepID=UPI001CF39B81|nr:type 3 dihydrofolate reductase [Methylophaga pinxianii]MCB2426067.1 type 3 dihydrofolate reductase [Methylophaga pinxianii]UPH45974.1 type 3 dihydrofolate reductase [Methylophaga pinxianii]
MKTAFVVAMDERGLIGRDNDLPWRLSADLQYFRRITMGKPILMGRNTHESIGRPLPGRQNIVVSSSEDYQATGCDVVNSIEAGLAVAADADEIMVIGGSSLFSQMFDIADTLYLTRVHAELDGDTWFPEWDKNQWQLISQESHPADEKNDYPYSFEVYRRI